MTRLFRICPGSATALLALLFCGCGYVAYRTLGWLIAFVVVLVLALALARAMDTLWGEDG